MRISTPGLPALAVLSTASIASAQASDCNNTTYTAVAKEGVQADTVVSTGCGSVSFTISVSIQADGSIWIASGSAQGAITVTLQGPANCNTDFIEYSGAIHECAGPLEGTHCDPEGARVQVTKWTNASPCPTLSGLGVQGLQDLLNGLDGAGALIGLGLPISLPCGEMVDDTDSLDPDARVRKTARISKCKSKEAGAFILPDGATTTANGYFANDGGASYWITSAPLSDALRVEFEHALEQSSRRFEVTGLDALYGHLHTGDPALLPPLAAQIWNAHAPIPTAPSLSCESTVVAAVQDPAGSQSWSKRTDSVTGRFSSDGNASFVAAKSVVTDSGVESFMHEWTLVEGDLYHHESSSNSGMVYLAASGATAVPRATSLQFLDGIQSWLSNPFGLITSEAGSFSVEETGTPELVTITQSIAAVGYDQATTNPLARSLFGKSAEFDVSTSGEEPRVLERRDLDGSGYLQRKTRYRDYREVLPGTWRPTRVIVDHYDVMRGHVRSEVLEFSGRFSSDDAPLEIGLPSVPGVEWSFLLGGI